MTRKIFQTICLLILTHIVNGQEISINYILKSIWILENEKFDNYQTYLHFTNNEIYKFELKNGKLFKSNNYKLSKYYFLSDSTTNLFINESSSTESIKFFNKKQNKILLRNDKLINFKKDITIANIIQFGYQNDTISSSHLYTYQFYNQKSFNQYGYGWTPGQPQIGYIYNLATNVPKSVIQEIQKISPDFFFTVKPNKSYIYKTPKVLSNTYIIKDDIVELIEKKENWFKIRYYGKSTIEGWIKKSDVE